MTDLQEIFEKSVNSPHNAAFMAAFKKILVARGFFQTYLPERIRRHIDFDSLEITDGTYHARNEDESTVRGYIDQGMDKINDENARSVAMTVAEQIRQSGVSSLLYSMLRERFGTVTPALEAKLRNADTDMLNRFGTSLFRFRKIHDAEKWWDDYGKKGNA